MQRTEQVLLKQYREYLEFLEQCQNKKYENELVLHNHHVIPTFIHTDIVYKKRTVLLSVEDHMEAHYRMSKCFDEGSFEQIGNLRAAKLISKKSIKYRDDLLKIYESQKGENNPAKLPENRKKITQGLVKYFQENENPKNGKSYQEIYGDRAEQERAKRKKCTRTPEEYRLSAIKTSLKNKGRVSHNAQQVEFEGQVYRSLAQASAKSGVSTYKIKQQIKNEKNSN
jgi:hypothetical protein